MRGVLLFIWGLLLQSMTFLLCIQLQQTRVCMSAAEEGSIRAHRTVIPWTHGLARPVLDGVLWFPVPRHWLAPSTSYTWDERGGKCIPWELSGAKQRQNLFFSWVNSPILFIVKLQKHLCLPKGNGDMGWERAGGPMRWGTSVTGRASWC